MKSTIEVLERAFTELANGTAILPQRSGITLPGKDGWLGVMPTYLSGMNALTTKIVTFFSKNPEKRKSLSTIMATVLLNDPDTGELLSIMEGSFITAIRTGAVGGLAAKYLSRADSRTVGIFGAGVQARTQLLALKEVRKISSVLVYDTAGDRAESFAEEMTRYLLIPVKVAPGPKEAVDRSDIIVTASTSKVPVFDGNLRKPGTHINAVGGFIADARELDSVTVKRSKVVVDFEEAALTEAGDLIIPLKKGEITKDHIYSDLGGIVTGRKPGRVNPMEITLFKSVGLGIQDCATALLAYRKAREAGAGTKLDLGSK